MDDCPKNYDDADAWAKVANQDTEDWERPVWSWDCNFKLDFDGPILRFNSRFYPPAEHYGPKWDGSVSVFLFDQEIHEEKFECDTLEQLRGAVEGYTSRYCEWVASKLMKGMTKEQPTPEGRLVMDDWFTEWQAAFFFVAMFLLGVWKLWEIVFWLIDHVRIVT